MTRIRLLACRVVACALAALTSFGSAELRGQSIVTIPSMNVPHTLVDMDAVGSAGPTSLGELNFAGSNGLGTLQSLILSPNGTVPGIYNNQTANGRALGLNPSGSGQLVLVDPPNGGFQGFDLELTVLPSTEFGLAIGDWDGSAIVSFFDGTTLIERVTTTQLRLGQQRRFFRLQPGGSVTTFDRIEVEASSPIGNWVLQELWLDRTDTAGLIPFGRGCVGGNGLPELAAAPGADPSLGMAFPMQVRGAPQSVLPGWLLAIGVSNTQSGFGPLPYDLTPLRLVDCTLYQSLDFSLVGTRTGSQGQLTLQLPMNPVLSGVVAWVQGFFVDLQANPFGLVVSNAGRLEIR